MNFNIENRGDLSITKALLLNALFELAKKKPVSDISISDLAGKAQVSRATFYNNYKDIDDLIMEYFYSVIIPNFESRIETSYKDAYEYGLFLFRFIYSERNYFRFLEDNDKLHLVLDIFIMQGELPMLKNALYSKSNHTPELQDNYEYINIFYAGGLYMMLSKWIKNGMKDSPEKMAEIYSGLGPVLKNK